MDELASVKSIIRSMLISEPSQQMTLREIAWRHREDEGKPIPFTKLGFYSLEQFFRSIPDTVQISGYGDEALLRPVISKEVSHIQSMILRQKPPKSKGRPRPRSYVSDIWSQPRQPPFNPNYSQNAGRFRQQQWTPPDHRSNTSTGGHSYHKNAYVAGTSSWQPTYPKKEVIHLPPSLYKKLEQIVREDPGQSIQTFESSIKLHHPFLMGIFPNIIEVVNAVEMIHISNGCVHLTNQKDPGNARQDAEMNSHQGIPSARQIIPAGMESDSDHETFDEKSYHSSAKELPSSKPTTEDNESKNKRSTFEVHAAVQRLQLETSQGICINPDLKGKLVDLLRHYSTGIWCSSLPEIFLKYYQFQLDSRESGFKSLIEMLKSCPETFVCVQENGSWKVSNAKACKPTTSPAFLTEKVKEYIKQLLVKYPNGIHIDSFADLYQKHFNTKLLANDMSFDNVDDLFLSINNTVIKMKRESNRFVILPLEMMENHEAKKPAAITITVAVKADPGILDWIPNDCVHPGYEFPELVMPQGIIPGSSLNLIIASVSNVDNFFVHIRGRGYSESLDNLTDNMTDFYVSKFRKYHIPPELVVPGIICVTLTFGEYSRCSIVTVKDSETVTVMPVDYGCTMTAKRNKLLFLHKDFAQLPQQAINCRCANLAPPFGEVKFLRGTATRFLELVKDKALYALVSQYDYQRNFLSVCLTDTSGDEDIHINDVLCLEGLAMFKRDIPITDIPLVDHRVKWEPPAALKEVPAKHTDQVDSTDLIEEEEFPQHVEESQVVEEPEHLEKLEEKEASQPAMAPPPGFKPLRKSQIETNMAWARVPCETPKGLFMDLDQLMVIDKLAKGEPDSQEIFPSPASLQEKHFVQELQTGFVQQNHSAISPRVGNSPRGMLEPDRHLTVCDEFSSLEQLTQLSPTTTSVYGHQGVLPHDGSKQNSAEGQVVFNGLHTDHWKHVPRSQSVDVSSPGILASQVQPNSANIPDTSELPRTVQVEFTLEDLAPMQPGPLYESPLMPPNQSAAPTNFTLFQNQNIPIRYPQAFHPPSTVFQGAPLFQTKPPNFTPTCPVPNRPVFPPFPRFGWSPPGFGPFQPCVQGPSTFQVPFVDNGLTIFPPAMQPSRPSLMPGMQSPRPPLMQLPPSFGCSSTNSPDQHSLANPSFVWNNQSPDPLRNLYAPPAPKKILEIRSPTTLELQNIPHAANLPDKVKESLSTSNSTEKSISDSKEKENNNNKSKITLQTDFSNGSSEASPNAYSQSTYPLKNDKTKDQEKDRNSYSEDSLDGKEHEDEALQAMFDVENDFVMGNELEKKTGSDKNSLEEDVGFKERPQSPTPLSSAVREMHGSLDDTEQQFVKAGKAKHSLNPAVDLYREARFVKNAEEDDHRYKCNQRRSITTIDVAGKPLHVFWINGHPYLEVEPLLGIGKLRVPVALKIIKTKSINKKLYELKAKTNSEIFTEMANLGIFHANHLNSANAKLLLVNLYDVPELLLAIDVADVLYLKELHLQVYLHPIE